MWSFCKLWSSLGGSAVNDFKKRYRCLKYIWRDMNKRDELFSILNWVYFKRGEPFSILNWVYFHIIFQVYWMKNHLKLRARTCSDSISLKQRGHFINIFHLNHFWRIKFSFPRLWVLQWIERQGIIPLTIFVLLDIVWFDLKLFQQKQRQTKYQQKTVLLTFLVSLVVAVWFDLKFFRENLCLHVRYAVTNVFFIIIICFIITIIIVTRIVTQRFMTMPIFTLL